MALGGRAFGRCTGHEGVALMPGISALREEAPQNSLALSNTGGHSEKTAFCEPGSKLSPEAKSAGDLILNFPASKIGEVNACL